MLLEFKKIRRTNKKQRSQVCENQWKRRREDGTSLLSNFAGWVAKRRRSESAYASCKQITHLCVHADNE